MIRLNLRVWKKEVVCNTIIFLDFLEDNFDFSPSSNNVRTIWTVFCSFFEIEKEIKIVSEILPPKINASFAYVL